MRNPKLCLLLIIGFMCHELVGQNWVRMDGVRFTDNGKELKNPFVGGMNQPQFSPMDLDGDGKQDLVVFDRAGEKVTTYLNNGTTGVIDYTYAPEYQVQFPAMEHWALVRDYNGDGKGDIFTASNSNGITIYENTSSGGSLTFTKKVSTLRINGTAVYVSAQDLPSIDDIDNDGDLDILSFTPGGLQVGWYKNESQERYGNNDSLEFSIATTCWGEFQEDGLSNTITLNMNCKGITSFDPADLQLTGSPHAGSTLATFDIDGDNDCELVLGDINYSNLVYLNNGGSPTSSEIDSTLYFFPPAAPVDVFLFPAAFFIDVNNDGLEDMIVASNAPNISATHRRVLLYLNIGTAQNSQFRLETGHFLGDEMVECGSASNPTFFDHNGDGLMDLLIGNYLYKTNTRDEFSSVTYYENVGTASQPAFELKTRDYMGLSKAFNPEKFRFRPALGDLDNDGDLDMMLGDDEGKISWLENIGQAGDSARFQVKAVNFGSMDVGQSATPVLYDVNGDNLLDLVIGERFGNLNYYQNKGTASSPVFGPSAENRNFGEIDVLPGSFTGYSTPLVYRAADNSLRLIVGASTGRIFEYKDLEGNLTAGSFTLLDSVLGNVLEGGQTALAAADIDDDGKIEFAVGNLRGGIALYKSDIASSTEESLQSEKVSEITLFPNPSQGTATLQSDEAIASVRIVDIQGRMVSNLAGKGALEVTLPEMVPGFYLVQVIDRKGIQRAIKWQVQ
ncbi:MAG: T9SS type A sorting domain-containing protein [Bacteroidota bacterium]